MSTPTPAIILGGTGYVAGELLRLIAGHPDLEVAAILSDSQPGEPVAGAFPHLRSAYPELEFSGIDTVEAQLRRAPRSAGPSQGDSTHVRARSRLPAPHLGCHGGCT